MPAIRPAALKIFRELADLLVVYDLERIDQDLLKQLYQNLVDPKTRHQLGEYYTPDWLAELTLDSIGYAAPQSLYDPTCGSGTFLFSAIKRLSKQGLQGRALVEFCVENVVGTDVHPLAVTIARLNYLLALVEHLREASAAGTQLLTLPVFMADALLKPLEGEGANALLIPTSDSKRDDEHFQIPYDSTRDARLLGELVDRIEQFAHNAQSMKAIAPNVTAFQKLVSSKVSPESLQVWTHNLKLLTRLKAEDRNGIWAYILKNLARPLALAQRKFDVVVGNPPWLSYNDIRDNRYKSHVKMLYLYYKLIASKNTKLLPHIDLSTLFYALVRDRYLKAGGTLAFVMPRMILTGAKQHRAFQEAGYIRRVLDMQAVTPLFNVETCVAIYDSTPIHIPVPSIAYTGKLPFHEMEYAAAVPYLTNLSSTISFADNEVRSPYYYDQFFQGATLVPRNLCLVKPTLSPNSPAVITDPDADKEAKAAYKGVKLSGIVEDAYIYMTLLSKHLLPFGYDKLHMVALPVRREGNTLTLLSNENDFIEHGHFDSWTWFCEASAIWDRLKKAGSKITFYKQLNFRNKITSQNPAGLYKVLYNSSGTNVSSCVLDTTALNLQIYHRQTQGFICDSGTYCFGTESFDEAHYLCAILNAASVSKAIKPYQTRGIYAGERHISRTPFEACAIPPFDRQNSEHMELVALSVSAHQEIDFLRHSPLSGKVDTRRDKARQIIDKQLKAIDVITRRVLNLS
jgi:hypothetical protein